jgi:hypothetical protein
MQRWPRQRRRTGVPTLIATLAILAPLQARAQLTDEDMCRSGGFPSEASLRIAVVASGAAARLYFLRDDTGCPQQGGDKCRLGPYVVAGDELLLGKTHGQWTCAWFNGKKHESVGWVANADLVQQPAQQITDWTGRWRFYNDPGRIDIEQKNGRYRVDASTIHRTPASENMGSMTGEMKVNGNRAHFGGADGPEQYECVADFTRVGRYLVVRDNRACGGVGVSFDGVYTRVR